AWKCPAELAGRRADVGGGAAVGALDPGPEREPVAITGAAIVVDARGGRHADPGRPRRVDDAEGRGLVGPVGTGAGAGHGAAAAASARGKATAPSGVVAVGVYRALGAHPAGRQVQGATVGEPLHRALDAHGGLGVVVDARIDLDDVVGGHPDAAVGDIA